MKFELLSRQSFQASLLASVFLLSACSSIETSSTNSSSADEPMQEPAIAENNPELDAAPEPSPEVEIEYGQFSEDILNRVILAEMASQRGLNQQALEDYLSIANETKDINIVKRASRLATFLRNTPASMAMTTLWLEIEPDSQEALQTLSFQLITQGRYLQAVEHLSTLINLGYAIDFRLISTRTAQDNNAYLVLDALISKLEILVQQYPDNLSIFLSLAHLYQQNDQIQEAYDSVTTLASVMNNAPEVVVLEVQLLEQLNRGDDASRRLQESLNSNPQHKQLRLLYGRKLIDDQRFDEAQLQFAIIVEQNPEDYEMLYSLALINMEVNRFQDAKRSFQGLIENGQRLDDAHFYLAFISTQENDSDLAIEHYLQVNAGPNFLPAQRNVTELMVQKGQYSEASARLQGIRFRNPDYNIALLSMEANVLIDEGLYEDAKPFLNSAIGAFPNNTQLLFLRSVLSQEVNNLPLMEEDLRKLIQLNPNSPVAYNSLGYTLADRTDRYQEAYELIARAYELSPDDPAIIDSLGWIQYHLGLYNEAQENLEKAFELFPDHEVAAHLGEVLWIQGNTREANRVWNRALEVQPDSSHILEAMERLKSSPSI